MNLVRQTDFRLPPMVNHYGCYFRSLQGIAEFEVDRRLRAQEIARQYKVGRAQGYMTEDCVMKRGGAGGGTTNEAFRALGEAHKRCYQVGSIDATTGRVSWWGPKEHTYTILLGRTKRGNRHYRLGDSLGNLIFDPDITAEIGSEICQLLYLVREVV